MINANGASPAWLLAFASFAADYLLYAVPVILAGMWLWSDRREAAVKAVFVALIALGIGQLIGYVYVHPRPFMVPIGHTFIQHASNPSFPSDHGIVLFSVSLAFILCRARFVGVSVFIVGLLVAWSRVYLGVHFPFDMTGALLVAVVACAVVWYAWNPVGVRIMALSESLYRIILARPITAGWIRR